VNLSDALKYTVLADFHSGDKRDQFAGLLHTTATDPQFGMGLLADFADEHEHPLAPVFRRLANGEAVREGLRQDVHRHLIDNTFDDPTVSLSLHNKTADRYQPYAQVELHHHFEHGPVWVVGTHTGWKKSLTDPVDDWPEHSHAWVLPAHPEEIANFQKALEAEPQHQRSAREVKAFQARSENMQHHNPQPVAEQHRSLEKALKYVTAQPEDMLHLLHHSGNESSLIWADLLDDHFHSDLANRVRREADGSAKKRPQPSESSRSQDDVQWHLHTRHPSPAIRALADGTDDKPQIDYLVKSLRLSPAHADQDAGVWLAPKETPHQHHAANTHFKALSNRRYREAGLVPKLVGDTLYLLDWEHPPEASYSAPAIRYHAPVSDRKDLDGMVQHAEQLLRERQEQGLV